MTTTLAFDAAAHRYALGDRELLGVTSVLAEAGLIDGRWFSEDAAARGTYVHQALALLHQDDLDMDALPADMRPYIEAYVRFVEQSGFTCEAWEERVWCERLGCAGTLDLRGRFADDAQPWTHVLDIKTGAVPSWVGYQTAAYARLLPRDLTPLRKRWCLQLSADGTYRLHPLRGTVDEKVFLAALTIAQAKRGAF
jgi:hypothetical protein